MPALSYSFLTTEEPEADSSGWTRRKLTTEELADLDTHSPPAAEAQAAPPSAREQTLTKAASLPADTLLSLTLSRHDLWFRWRELRRAGRTDEERAAILAYRQVQVEQWTQPIENKLVEMGAQDVEADPSSPTVHARLAAGQVAALRTWAEVEELNIERKGQVATAGYDGELARQGMRVKQMLDLGYDGSLGHPDKTTKVRVGIADSENLYTPHVAFKRAPGDTGDTIFYSPNQTQPQTLGFQHRSCVGVSYCQLLDPFPTVYQQPSHATNVARVLLGSLEAGQDIGIPATALLERRQKGGVGRGSAFYGYHYGVFNANGGQAADLQKALGRAVTDTLDVINLSLAYPSDTARCTSSSNPSNINTALANAIDAGVLPITTAGNLGLSSTWGSNTWTVTYPGCRRDGLTVGGLDTPSTQDYNTAARHAESGKGGMDFQSTVPSQMAVVDLMAPYTWRWEYKAGTYPNNYVASDFGGTSFSAPAVAASAATFRHAWQANRPNVPLSARELLTHMLLMGDGYAASKTTPPYYSGIGMDRLSGAGRVHMHVPANADLGATGTWGWSNTETVTLGTAQGATFQVPTLGNDARQLKIVATWAEPRPYDLGTADVKLRLYNPCAAQGSTLVAEDMSNDLRKRIVVLESDYEFLPGACFQLDVLVRSVPSDPNYSSTRTVKVAWYWHSQADTSAH